MTPSCPPSVFFFNDTATTEIYTLSLHDALPISDRASSFTPDRTGGNGVNSASSSGSRMRCHPRTSSSQASPSPAARSEEHTSELQSRQYLVCRLLLEKKRNAAR